MNRCSETSGILFKKPCQFPATGVCSTCNKPICRVHVRVLSNAEVCIACARATLDDPAKRHSYIYLRDDPYFFWYYQPDEADPYTHHDYALFEAGGAEFGSAVDDQWEGT